MTVAELIDALRQLPADAPVLVDGAEMGLTAKFKVIQRKVAKEPDTAQTEWWEGEFDLHEDVGGTPIDAVLISRVYAGTSVTATDTVEASSN